MDAALTPSCECRKNLEAQLTERFKGKFPEATDHDVKLEGFGFAIIGNRMTMRPCMPYKAGATHALKKGGTKWKAETGSMFFSYCPFCGVKVGEGGVA